MIKIQCFHSLSDKKKAILSETLFWYNGKFTMLKNGYNNGYSCRLLSRYMSTITSNHAQNKIFRNIL